MKRALLVLASAMLLFTTAQARQTSKDDAERLLKAAQNTEVVDDNPRAAIKQYQAIVDRFSKTERGVAAAALLRMAECYRKFGDGEAQKIYQQLVRDYADQLAVASQARARLLGPTELSHRVVWTMTGSPYFYGAISSDARYVAYGDFLTGELFTRELATGVKRKIATTANPEREHTEGAAAFSRDGRQLAYDWFKPADGPGESGRLCELRVIDVDGSTEAQPRVLVHNPDIKFIEAYAWTPDGTRVLVQVSRQDGVSQLGVVSVKNGAMQTLMSTGWHGGSTVFLSPDGRYIAFDRPVEKTGPRDIFVLALDASRQVPVVVHPADDVLVGWSPDGHRLLFTSNRTGSSSLWAVPFNESSGQVEPELIRRDIGSFEWSLGLTTSGAVYTFVRGGNATTEMKTASLDFATGRVVSRPLTAAGEFTGPKQRPLWSPDGKSLSWIATKETPPTPAESSVVVRSLEDGRARELKLDLHSVFPDLRWSPDSRSLIILGSDREGRNGLYRVDVQSGAISVLAVGGPFRSERGLRLLAPDESWSLDGSKFYFLRNAPTDRAGTVVELTIAGGERELFEWPGGVQSPNRQFVFDLRTVANGMEVSYDQTRPNGTSSTVNVREMALIERNLASNVERELIRGVTNGLGNAVSPDGRHLLVSSLDPRTKTWSLVRVSVADGSYRELIRHEQPGLSLSSLAWASDGSAAIARKTLPDGSSEYWWLPMDSRAPHKLTDFTNEPISDLQVHRDGTRVVFLTTSRPTPPEVWVLENFLPAALRKR